MNNKITFPKLAALLAEKSGRSKRFSEDFLREMFMVISEQLEAGDSVKVKGFGTFRLSRVEPRKSVDVTTGQPMEISGHSKVVFTPSKELAEAVNAPFEAFTSIEIADDVDIASLDIEDGDSNIELSQDIELIAQEPDTTATTEPAVREPEPQLSDMTQVTDLDQTSEFGKDPALDLSSVVEELPEVAEKSVISNPVAVDSDVEKPEYVEESYSEPQWNQSNDDAFDDDYHYYPKSNWKRNALICACCAIGAVMITFVVWNLLTRPDFSHLKQSEDLVQNKVVDDETFVKEASMVIDDIVIDADSLNSGNLEESDLAVEEEVAQVAETVPTVPSDVVVYDTIGKKRYLTTMAKDHYGNNKLWPYIYEENKTRIGHPDKIRPGTPIIIPDLRKYGVDPSNPDDIVKANRLGVEIYARYNKSI